MIIDCFSFYNELELLEIRLEELKEVVDWFVLVEAAETFSGKPKPLVFEANRERFQEYNIVHIKIDKFPATLLSSWQREWYTRDAIMQGLLALELAPSDVIILSDVNEIPRAAAVASCTLALTSRAVDCFVFHHTLSYYYVNCQTTETLQETRMTLYQNLTGMQALRCQDGKHIFDGGWHFSYMGGAERIRDKIGATSHTELDLPRFNSIAHIEQCLATGADLFGRNIRFSLVPLDSRFPQFLMANRTRFASLIAPDSLPRIEQAGSVALPALAREIKLDLGSGGKSDFGPDWLGVDAYVAEADIQAQMWELPFGTSSVTAIFSSHALEHVPLRQVQPTLEEWHRVLKPGGNLTLRVPDLAWCMAEWLQYPTMGFEMMRIFGNQGHEGEFHQCGFTAGLLQQSLVSAGFEVHGIETVWSHAQQTLSAKATKPKEEYNR